MHNFVLFHRPSLYRQERGGCAGPLRCGKATTWEGGIRLPAFWHWPGRIEPRKSFELFSAMDILPTIMNVIGEPIQDEVNGVDQSKFIFSNEGVILIRCYYHDFVLKEFPHCS